VAEERKPYGLAFRAPRAAGELEREQIIVLDGHVVEVSVDPADSDRVRVTLIRALGPPPGPDPDQREIQLICPRDMIFSIAEPSNIELAPLPPQS
jgi:hypothetical protein